MKKKQRDNRFFYAAFFAMLFTSSVGLTQPRDNPLERARHHMELGQEAFSREMFEEAGEQFINAFSASPFSAFLYNAGLAYEKADNNEKAVDLYRRYLEAEPEASDYAKVDMKIRVMLAGAETSPEAQVEITEVEMKSLISVRTNPPEATIRILDTGGKEVSRTDGSSAQTVVRGRYVVEASHPDFRTVQTSINVIPGQVYIIVVEMSQGAFLGFLHIKTDVPGASVYIDERSKGKVGITPWGNVLPAGKHTIWVEKPGYEPIEQEFEMNLGEEAELTLALERLSFGTLLVKTNTSDSKIYVDEKLFGTAPLEFEVPPGIHKLEVVAKGMKNYNTDVEVKRGRQTKILVRMNPTPSRTSAWVSLGFSTALFVGGGIAGYMALKIDDELESSRNNGRLTNDDPRILRGFLWALGADLAFGVGTIVGSLCIYYFLRDPLPPSEGKLFDPIDFEEAPKKTEKGDSKKGEKPPLAYRESNAPTLLVVPLLSTQTAGLGIAVTF